MGLQFNYFDVVEFSLEALACVWISAQALDILAEPVQLSLLTDLSRQTIKKDTVNLQPLKASWALCRKCNQLRHFWGEKERIKMKWRVKNISYRNTYIATMPVVYSWLIFVWKQRWLAIVIFSNKKCHPPIAALKVFF